MTYRLLLAAAMLVPTFADAQRVIFADDFEGGAGALRDKWEVRRDGGGDVTIVDAGPAGKVVCISRSDRNGLTFITRRLPSVKGDLRVEAQIRSEDVKTGSNNFKGGQFHAVVSVSGREVNYPKSDFDGSFEWTPLAFDVYDLTPDKTVTLRIGLQQGRGTMCVNNVRVVHTE